MVPGSQVKFTVDSASAELTYQWQRNGVDLSDGNDVTGTTTGTLKFANVEKSNEGKYTCVVTNVAGVTTTSNTLQLIVRKCLFLLCLINFYLLCVCVYVCVYVCV